MLHFNNLKKLIPHHAFLTKKIGKSDFFLVGGCVREILLGTTKNPLDIDFTMAGNPLEIYENIDKDGISHFITEKYGTITLIPKDKDNELKYELTPLRAETGYQDCRHPEEIFWSDDLLLDVQRRDFTINAIYYTQQKLKTPVYEQKKIINEEMLLKILNKEGFIYLQNNETLIIQSQKLLSQLIPNAKLDTDFLYYLLDIQPYAYIFWAGEKKGKKQIQLQILIDPALGIQDLVLKKLRTVGNPDTRFQEDSLRLLRGLRFVNVLNQKLLTTTKNKKSDPINKVRLFDFEPETWKSIKSNHNLLKTIAKERIKEELTKAFSQGNPFGLVGLLDEAEMLVILFPALALTKYIDQPIRYHPFDIYSHIILTLYHLQAINTNYLVRFAMLYHDVGKVGQYAEYGKNLSKEEIRILLAGPLNHRFSSAVLAEEDFRNLWFSHKEIEEIQRYIREHHTPWEILLGNPQNRAKRLRKLLSDAGFERVNNLLDINIADRMGMYNPLQNASDLSDSRYLKKLLLEIEQEEGQFRSKDLAVKGRDIMEYFNLIPGKIIGELLEVALDRVLGDIKNRNKPDQIFANLANHLKNLEGKK